MSGDGMAEIVDWHEYDVDLSSGLPRPACACGWKAEREWSGAEVHSAHVAAALRAAGYGLVTACVGCGSSWAEIDAAIRTSGTTGRNSS